MEKGREEKDQKENMVTGKTKGHPKGVILSLLQYKFIYISYIHTYTHISERNISGIIKKALGISHYQSKLLIPEMGYIQLSC